MREREYERLKAEAKSEYLAKLAAIETVWKMSGGASPNGSRQPTGKPSKKGAILDNVRYILPELHGEFTVNTVLTKLFERDADFASSIKRPSLSSVLRKLQEEGRIHIVEPGSGRRPSRYKLKVELVT